MPIIINKTLPKGDNCSDHAHAQNDYWAVFPRHNEKVLGCEHLNMHNAPVRLH